MAKRQDLYLQRRSRPEQSDQCQPNQAANISHQPRASPDSTSLASRIEFPTMTLIVGVATFLKDKLNIRACLKFESALRKQRLFKRNSLLILRHGRRRILWLGVTAHPTAEWIAHQLTEACGWEAAPRYIIRDRDRVYGEVFTRRLRAMGIRDRPTAPRSPWQNGHTEQLIGSIRRECLGHVVVFGERHLRHVLLSYMQYYNVARTHLSLNKDAPVPRAAQAIGRILPTPILGGLHHQYVRI